MSIKKKENDEKTKINAAARLLNNVTQKNGKVTVLTGAGVSKESCIPTFRRPEGFRTVGSREYHFKNGRFRQ